MGYMNSKKEMLEQMKNDLDKLNDMLKKVKVRIIIEKKKQKLYVK